MRELHAEDPGGSSVNSPVSEKTAAAEAASPKKSVASHPDKPSGLQVWAQRVGMILFVSLCASSGVLLVILPWTPKWTDNYLLMSFPNLSDFLENGFVRGVCTGLGLLDIWIGFSEATHYQEPEKSI